MTFSLFCFHQQEYLGRDDLSFVFSLKVSPTSVSMVLYLRILITILEFYLNRFKLHPNGVLSFTVLCYVEFII